MNKKFRRLMAVMGLSGAMLGNSGGAPAERIALPCGVVEGFYGRPWSHEDRLEMVRFLGEHGFNEYCYAPKDDPYHRHKWREPYPPEEFARLRELYRACARARVTFRFAISPALDIEYSNPEELRKLAAKLEPLARDGVRAFALFFDDVPSTFTHASDAARYASFARAQADLANRLYAVLRDWNARNSLVVCPTEYYHADATPYLRELSRELRPEIGLVWTGIGVAAPKIDSSDAMRLREIIGRKPVLWDNYPVNDYDQGHIFLGPLERRSPLLPLALGGYWSNPMNQAELSKIPLLTIADYLRSPESYCPEASWRAAVRRVVGARSYTAFMKLADLMSGFHSWGHEAEVLCALVGDYFEAPSPASLANVRRYLEELSSLESTLDRTLSNRRLFDELRPSLKRLRVHVRNLQLALRVEELGAGTAEGLRLRESLRAGLAAVDTPTTEPAPGSAAWYRLLADETTVFPGNVADETFARIQQLFHSRWTRQTSPTLPMVMAAPPAFGGQFAEGAIDGREQTAFRARAPWRTSDYLAVDFGRMFPPDAEVHVVLGDSAKERGALLQNGVLEVSSTGATWTPIGSIDRPHTALRAGWAFRCVRLAMRQDQSSPVIVREIAVEPNEKK